MYGGGLRVSECVSLRVKDVDLDRCEIVVRGGKGNKDRRVPLPRVALPSLRTHLERVKAGYLADFAARRAHHAPARRAERQVP